MRSGLHQLGHHPERIVALVIGGGCLGPPLLLGTLGGGIALGAGLPSSNQAVLTAAFAGIGLLLLALGFSPTIGRFFTDRGLLFLLSTPLSPTQVYAARLTSAFWAAGLAWVPLLLFSLGIGLGRRAGIAYALAAILICSGWTVAIVAAQVGLLSLVLRVVPVKRARDATVAAAIFCVCVIGASQIAAMGVKIHDISGLMTLMNRLSWLPSVWPARALEAFARSDVGGGLYSTGVAIVPLVALIVVAGTAYRQALATGVGALAEGATPVRRRRLERGVATEGPAAPTWGLVQKDWRVLRRDARQLLQFVPAVIIGVVYPLALLRNFPAGGIGEPDFWGRLFWLGFLPFWLSTALALPAMPQEGRALQLLRLAPRRPAWVLRAKLWFALPPALVAAAINAALVLTVQRVPAIGVVLGVVTSCWWAVGFTAIGLAGGAIWPNVAFRSGLRGVTLSGLMMVSLGDAGFGLSSLAGVSLLVLAVTGRLPVPALFALLGIALLMGAIVVAFAFLWVALNRLAHAEPGTVD